MWHPFPVILLTTTIVFLVVATFNRRAAGFPLILLAFGLHFGAIEMYHSEYERLAGRPDLLYVWIVPLFMMILSIAASVAAILWNAVDARRKRRAATRDDRESWHA